jgi:hypothetical protein
MEKDPWYKNVEGPFLQWKGPIGVKEDGGGCTRAQGRVGNMVIHRAAFNKNKQGMWLYGVNMGFLYFRVMFGQRHWFR